MRTMQYQNARYRIGLTPICTKQAVLEPADWVVAALGALDGIEDVVSGHWIARPDTLTQDDITAYALALMHLRECASAAGFERLTNACDALAVTVARLIEDRSCASREKCEALTRFVVHARAMIQMSADSAKTHAMPIPVTGGVRVKRGVRAPV